MNESFLSVVETRRFLGREFLTWLVERLEEHGGRIEIDSDAVDLALGDRVVLEAGGDPGARLTLVDEGDLRPELGVGLRRGKLLDRARISISRGERRWELTLDGGLLTYDSLRCPKLGPRDGEATDDRRAAFENDLFLRLADIEDAIEKFRRKHHLDEPMLVQYGYWLANVATLDFGNEFHRPAVAVRDELWERLKVTVPLSLVSVLLAYLLAIGLIERRPLSLGLSVLVLCLYGSSLFGLLPWASPPGVSWIGHTGGFIGGLLAAAATAQKTNQA